MIKAKDNFLVIETSKTSLILEIRDFDDPLTPFNKGKKFVSQYFYGFSNECPDLVPSIANIPGHGSTNDYNRNLLISSTYGNGNQKEPLLLIKNFDNTFINRFFYKEYKIFKGPKEMKGPHTRDVLETLEIVEVDDLLNIELHHYYSIVKDLDIIISKKEIRNLNKKDCNICRLFSLELPIKSTDLSVQTFDGTWLYERSRHVTNVTSGVFAVDSKIGFSSHRHNPYIQVVDNQRKDAIYGFNLIYSGNHKEQVEVNPLQFSTIMTGINDFSFSYKLHQNESFITPEAIFEISHSQDELTREMHEFVLKHIVNPNYVGKPRPVLFNNWEGTGFKIDEKSLLDMAVIAKKTGVEQFVVDDGWFKNRVNEWGGLGDWEVDLNKFPGGLESFVNKVKSLGLKFGIWIEPEMISIKSDLYEKHPEFACRIPSRDPIERRHQLTVDMSNEKAVDYIYNELCGVFDKIKPDYVKWDYNRYHADIYSSLGYRCGEVLYRIMYGSYELFDKLTKRYPNTMFEGCSSGGGRFDLGMLYYTPQIWGSDDTNTFCRSFITCGTLTAYPQSTFGAHVSRDGCPLENRNARSSLEDRFNLNSVGAFGYEFDFRTFEEPELKIIAKQIEYYKEHRELFQNGKFFINKNIFDDDRYFSFNVVSEDKKEAMLYCEETSNKVEPTSWKVKGINPNAKYLVKAREQYNLKEVFEKEYSGTELIEKGIYIGSLATTTDANLYPDGVFTRLFYIKEI